MDLEDGIKRVQEAGSLHSAFAAFGGSIELLGFSNANYVLVTDHPSISQPSGFGFATNYPEHWVDHYRENEYQEFDPVWLRLKERSGVFSWDEATSSMLSSDLVPYEASGNCQRIMNEAAEAGLADGIGISFINQFGEVAGIGLSRERAETSTNWEDVAQVALLSAILHEKIQSLHRTKETVALTPRERDVVSWASEGKTDSEIALILGISHPAIRFHWKNVFTKLETNSRILAIVSALRRRLIDPTFLRASK